MPKLSFQWLLIIGVVIFLVVGYVCYKSAIAPQLKYLHAAETQLVSQEKLLQVRKQKAEDMSLLQEKSEKFHSELDSVKNRLFNDATANDFLKLLPQLAKETNNNLTDIKFLSIEIIPLEDTSLNPSEANEAEEVMDYFAKLPMQLTIQGRYSNITKLLDRIENHESLISIDGIKIDTDEKEMPEVELHLAIGLYIARSKT